jgi:hypothetical protein
MPNAYVDLARVKDARTGLNITGSASDALLLQMAEAASRSVDDYTRRHFYVRVATRYYDGTGRPYLLLPPGDDLLEVTSLKLDENGDRAYELTLTATDYYLWPDNGLPKLRVDLVELVGKWGYADDRQTIGALVSGAHNATTTTLTTTSAVGMAIGLTLLIGSEQLYVTGGGGTSWTVERGVNGTTAATIADQAAIQRYRYPTPIVQATYMQLARWWKRKDDGFAQVLLSPDLGRMSVFRGLDPDVQLLLAPYVMPLVG